MSLSDDFIAIKLPPTGQVYSAKSSNNSLLQNTFTYSDTSLNSSDSYSSASHSSDGGERKQIQDLPNHILLRIFTFFTEKELGRNILPVCRKWRVVGGNPDLWKQFSFSFNQVPVPVICRLLRFAPKLKTLYLSYMKDVKTIIRQMCRCNKAIENVSVRFCTEFENLPEAVLRNILVSCKNLKSLDLKGTKFISHTFYQDLSLLSNLRSVNFGDNPNIRVQDILTIGLNCHELQVLKLARNSTKNKGMNMDNDDAIFLFTNLSRNLTILKLDCINLQSSAFESIMKCSKLRYLCLFNANAFSNTMFRNLWGYLPHLNKLKLLKATQLSSNDFFHLFTVGKNVMKNLTVLDISGCWKITDRGLDAVAECCNANLQKLSITSCKNIKSIDSVLKLCPNIRYLNVSHCDKLNNRCLKSLPNCLCRLSTLVVDDLEDNITVLQKLANRSKINIFISLSEYNKNKKSV